MSGESVAPRSLPDRPSLRHLKLEAKRRRSAGEFSALGEAQLAIAREHGMSSWTKLKLFVDSRCRPSSRALPQLRWIISRFAGADQPGWTAPGEAELCEHFSGRVLEAMPPAQLVGSIADMAAELREELVVIRETELWAEVRLAGAQIFAVAEAESPHRLSGLQRTLLGTRISDTRVAAPPTRMTGHVPGTAAETATREFGDLGLVGMLLAGATGAACTWTAATGWADLERDRPLDPADRFPAYGLSQPVTAVAVLRLVADGIVGLDEPANRYLRAVRLADATSTVRELLSHTAGVDHTAEPLAESVPALTALVGPVLMCSGERGAFRYSNEGYAALGELVSEVTGEPYPDAVTRLVLAPLRMSSSSFPQRWPGDEPESVTCYEVTPEGTFTPVAPNICTTPAAGGLWSTGADLMRLALGWRSLLPDTLAREALRPHAGLGTARAQQGLGWLLNQRLGLIASAGAGPGASASLLIRADGPHAHLALTNRRISIEPLNARVLHQRAADSTDARRTRARR